MSLGSDKNKIHSNLNTIESILNDNIQVPQQKNSTNETIGQKITISTHHPIHIANFRIPIVTNKRITIVTPDKHKAKLPIPDLFSLKGSLPQPIISPQSLPTPQTTQYSDLQNTQTGFTQITNQHPIPQLTVTIQPSYFQQPQFKQYSTITVQPQITNYQNSSPQYQQQNPNKNARLPIPHPVVSLPKTSQRSIQPPEPKFYNDKHAGRYGIRCVCGEGKNDASLIQCDLCNFWLHTRCVNVARVSENEPYYCPFCRGQRIRCRCGRTKNYSDTIIQCTSCKFWCHKECEELDYGFIPKDFVCSYCDPNKVYELPYKSITCSDIDLDRDIMVNCADKFAVISNIVDGKFKEMLTEDLNKGEISLCYTMSKYFHMFAPILFERKHEFWRCYCEVFSELFNVDRTLIMTCIDALANKLIYSSGNDTVYQPITEAVISDAITPNMEVITLQKMDSMPEDCDIYVKEGRVYTKDALDDNKFIVELPGFIEHYDEVRCENGIPYSCLSVTDREYVVDVSGSPRKELYQIRRSFHFNCIIKLIRVDNKVKAALYSTRGTGPLNDDKCKRGPAIHADSELILPLDGCIPFNTAKAEWKDKKTKSRFSHSHSELQEVVASPKSTDSTSVSKNRKKKGKAGKDKNKNKKDKEKEKEKKYYGEEVKLSLLSAFSSDIVPPMPFILVNEKTNKSKHEKSGKRKKHYTD